MNIIGSGSITSKEQFKDLVQAHTKDGYVKMIVCQPVKLYWELEFEAQLFKELRGLTGKVLILYCGDEDSFADWQKKIARAIEVLERERGTVQ